jgi:putative ABC transport system ATP-binding protein
MTGSYRYGKTTLLTLAGGLRSDQYESLPLLDNELFDVSTQQLAQARRSYAYILRFYNLHGSLTAIQNVRMGLELQSNISTQEMLNRSRAMLEKVGLGNKLNYYLPSL